MFYDDAGGVELSVIDNATNQIIMSVHIQDEMVAKQTCDFYKRTYPQYTVLLENKRLTSVDY